MLLKINNDNFCRFNILYFILFNNQGDVIEKHLIMHINSL